MRACTRACMQTWCGDSKVHADGIYAFVYNLQYLTGMHAPSAGVRRSFRTSVFAADLSPENNKRVPRPIGGLQFAHLCKGAGWDFFF